MYCQEPGLNSQYVELLEAVRFILEEVYQNKDVTVGDLVFNMNVMNNNSIPKALRVLNENKMVNFGMPASTNTKVLITFRGLWAHHIGFKTIINLYQFI